MSQCSKLLFLTEIFVVIIVDIHAVVRNNAKKCSFTLFLLVKLYHNIKTKNLTLVYP